MPGFHSESWARSTLEKGSMKEQVFEENGVKLVRRGRFVTMAPPSLTGELERRVLAGRNMKRKGYDRAWPTVVKLLAHIRKHGETESRLSMLSKAAAISDHYTMCSSY